jgi:phage-related protein
MDIVYFSDDIMVFIEQLNPAQERKALALIALLRDAGHLIRMPHSKPLGNGIFELRARGDQELRILYAYRDNMAILLHCFLKKSEDIPRNEIMLAMERMRSFDNK